MKLEGPAWNEASNKVRQAAKETKFLPGLLEEGDEAEAALRKAEAALSKKIKEIGETEAKTVDTNKKLTAGREKLASTMDQITTIDKNVDANKKTMASNSTRMGNIDTEITNLEAEQKKMALITFISDNPTDIDPVAEINAKIAGLKAEKAKLAAANAELKAKNEQLEKEKVPLVAIRDDLQKNVIPPLEAELISLTALHEKQVGEKWPLLTDRNTKSDKNNDVQKEITSQEQLVAWFEEDALARIQQYEEHVAAEPRPGPRFLDYGKSVWA